MYGFLFFSVIPPIYFFDSCKCHIRIWIKIFKLDLDVHAYSDAHFDHIRSLLFVTSLTLYCQAVCQQYVFTPTEVYFICHEDFGNNISILLSQLCLQLSPKNVKRSEKMCAVSYTCQKTSTSCQKCLHFETRMIKASCCSRIERNATRFFSFEKDN